MNIALKSYRVSKDACSIRWFRGDRDCEATFASSADISRLGCGLATNVKVLSALVAVGSLFAATASTCRAQYEFSTIDFPGAAETAVFGINGNGVVVGQYGDIDFSGPFKIGNRGFVYDGQSYETIWYPESQSTIARGINDDGVIVGGYVDGGGQTRGFMYDGSEYRDVVTPFAEGASVLGINNEGHFVGAYSGDNFRGDVHGFRFDGNEFESFDYPEALTTSILGINDAGEQAGFFSTSERIAGFVRPPPRRISVSTVTQVTAINNRSQIVGYYLDGRSLEEVWHQGFLFDTVTEDFFNIDLPGGECVFSLLEPRGSECNRLISGINGDRTIVGYVDNADGVYHGFVGRLDFVQTLEAGDADQDLDFDQVDLVHVQIAAKYLTAASATWGEGDWDGAPGGQPGGPPPGDGTFDEIDIVRALAAGKYQTGPYTAEGSSLRNTDTISRVVYDAKTGEVSVDAQTGAELTSIGIRSASGIFTGDRAMNLNGSFDRDDDAGIFKAVFGGAFGSLSFGNVARSGLSREYLNGDLTVIGSLAHGGTLTDVELVYVPAPTAIVLMLLSLLGLPLFGKRGKTVGNP